MNISHYIDFMRILPAVFLIIIAEIAAAETFYVAHDPTRFGIEGSAKKSFNHLQTAIDRAADGDTVLIAPGEFAAKWHPFEDMFCGNCQDPTVRVMASRGFLVEAKRLFIIGSGVDSTTLITNAGYGILFIDSPGSLISNLKITGGVRDRDGNATDAAIVARNSILTVENCLIADNTDRPEKVIVGIGGIFGREGAELTIRNNRLFNNGWDGIALYRGATAVICDNEIDGGRGAGIGITWDATAIAYRNIVKNYWKGIGAFGTSKAVISNNLVIDNLGWGIIATGSAWVDIANNLVIRNGNCGLAIWSDSCAGRITNNIIVENGWREEWVCPPVGFWNYGHPGRFMIGYNDVFNNAGGQYRDMPDQTDRLGNISADPLFKGKDDFRLLPDSPCRDSGDPNINDRDGSRSDMGLYGGPHGFRETGDSLLVGLR